MHCCTSLVSSLLKIICVLLQLKKHLLTASYINDSMCKLHDAAKGCGITILGEMGLDPGIGCFSFLVFSLSICVFIFQLAVCITLHTNFIDSQESFSICKMFSFDSLIYSSSWFLSVTYLS